MKKKLICMLLSIAVVFSFMPFFTVQAEASTTGYKTFVKTKTVTLKPGKTYKTSTFKTSKKMAFMIPLDAWISSADKGSSDTIKKGDLVINIKNSKGKKVDSFSRSLEGYGRKTGNYYSSWLYFNKKGENKGNFDVGKYYIQFKNTTKRTIQIKFSVRGYTKFASAASFKSKLSMESGKNYKLGKIGSGIPLIQKFEFTDYEDDYMTANYKVKPNGTTYLKVYGFGKATLKFTLADGKSYKVRINMKEVDEEI